MSGTIELEFVTGTVLDDFAGVLVLEVGTVVGLTDDLSALTLVLVALRVDFDICT